MIPFNRPYMTGRELDHIAEAHVFGHLSGDGPFSERCSAWLQDETGCRKALLTPSGTAALELSALLAGIAPGDEVIMPSFTFVSTANAFVLRGAMPVFVDIRPETLNLDETLIEAAITGRTKAVVPVHYAGVACAMDKIVQLAADKGLVVIEDAAHALLSSLDGKPLGRWGSMACLSFHETKNLTCGEGGAILLNTDELASRAEVIREKGTNRHAFFRGEVDKYTWVDIGSSFLLSELSAAFLWGQIEASAEILSRRMAIWNRYHEAFADLEDRGLVCRPVVPEGCQHNAHMYYLLLPDLARRERFISLLAQAGVHCVFHYVPLHQAPASRVYARACGTLPITVDASERLVRLPLWVGLEECLEAVVDAVVEAVKRTCA